MARIVTPNRLTVSRPTISGTGTVKGGGGSFLYDTTFANNSITGYTNEQITSIDGMDWFIWFVTRGDVDLVADVTAPSGKAMRFTFATTGDLPPGNDCIAGIINTTPIPGAGKKLHTATLLRYDGYSDFGGITTKKQIRINATGENRVCTLNAQFSTWRLSFEELGGGVFEQQSGPTPDSFIGAGYFWLEFMVDFTNITSAQFGVWVNGVSVSAGTATGLSGFNPAWNIMGAILATVFNQPSKNGTDHIGRIIYSNNFIGVP
jgi:hypothetical protein